MKNQPVNPGSICAPIGPYSQGVIATGGGKLLHIAGQVGLRPDGTVVDGLAEQAEVAWTNIVAILAECGMTVEHLVKITTYLVDTADAPAAGRVRSKFLGSARPASTLLVVKALAKPEFLFEVDATAFMPDSE